MEHFSTVFGQYLAPLGHARLMCIHSAGCPYPSLNGIFVAPSREFKSKLNEKAMQFFDNSMYLDLVGDETMRAHMYQNFEQCLAWLDKISL